MKFIITLTLTVFLTGACAETKTTNTNVASNTIVIASANANTQPTAAPDEFAEARRNYSVSCAACHGANGAGGEGLYQGKKVAVPSYQSKGAMNASDETLYRHIVKGEEDKMPAFEQFLTEQEMRDLVKFIRKEFQKK